nr:uncharacterized protein LOC106684467 isoform X2 [Halyomorpha halys]
MIVLILTYCLVAASVGQLTEDECFHCPRKEVEEGRILWGALGTLLEQLPFLPLTVNVPDIMYGMGDMMYNMYQYFFGGSNSSSTSSNTPRELYSIFELLI